MRTAPKLEDEGEYAVLVCPCRSDYLHHGDVRVYERGEDDPVALRTTVSQRHVTRDLKCPDTGPSHRRDGLVVAFSCECCARPIQLAIYQHKGQTFLEWQTRDEGLNGGLSVSCEEELRGTQGKKKGR